MTIQPKEIYKLNAIPIKTYKFLFVFEKQKERTQLCVFKREEDLEEVVEGEQINNIFMKKLIKVKILYKDK